MIGKVLGPYEVLDKLGEGGMGEVYRARDTRLGREVAIKVLSSQVLADPAFHERFDREARAISQLNHPHICVLHDVGTENGVPYLVLEYLEGETLATRLTRGALPLDQALTIGIQISDALARAHGHGIVHRDLKPANVMLTKGGAKLLDFGLAKPASPALRLNTGAVTVSAPLTADGTIVGTLQYMSPEQVEGRDADARSDLFAVGAVLYEMVTGRRAFEGKTPASVIAGILERQPPALSTLTPIAPPVLDHVVARCLAKDPVDRWQHAGDVMRELKWVSGDASRLLSANAPAARTRPWLWMGATALCAALAGAAWLTRTSPPMAPAQVPIQFSIAPPAGSSWTRGSPISISPDGRQLAFVARLPKSAEPGLWIRPMDSQEARALPGTETALHPFWSPDSRYLGFFVRGQLKKVAADGSSVQTICRLSEGFGGSWNRKDVVVFATLDGLFSVSAAGGEPTRMLEASRSEDSLGRLYAWPQFLPDGQHFLYVVRRGEREKRLHVGTLEDAAGRDIGPATSNAMYAPSGHLIFAQQQRLVAQPFDVNRLEATGEPVVLADDLARDSYGQRAVFAVSAAGTLAYRRDPPRDTQFAWFDRAGQRLGALGPPGPFAALALSPDGRTVAFVRRDPSSGVPDIWLMDVERGIPSRFSFDAGSSAAPIWSPDSTQILFAVRNSRLVAKSIRSGEEQPIADLGMPGATYANDWSADGRHILFDTRSKTADVWRLPLAGDRRAIAVSATAFHEMHSRLSPDGKWVAYESDESGQSEVYIRLLDGSGRAEPVSSDGGTWPQWRRGDGAELYYLAADGRVMAVQVKNGDGLQLSGPRSLFESTAIETERYAVTADGQRFLMVTSADTDRLNVTVVVNWLASVVRK